MLPGSALARAQHYNQAVASKSVCRATECKIDSLTESEIVTEAVTYSIPQYCTMSIATTFYVTVCLGAAVT